ncbi:hypothetical protein Tco_1134721 [Tanacetum coccineum]
MFRVDNVQGRQNRGHGNNARGAGKAGYGGAQNIDGNANPGQPKQDLALNVDNVFQADDCDAFDYDVDEAPTTQTMFMANVLSADPVYDEAGPSYDSDILSEVQVELYERKALGVEAEVDQNGGDRKLDEIEL